MPAIFGSKVGRWWTKWIPACRRLVAQREARDARVRADADRAAVEAHGEQEGGDERDGDDGAPNRRARESDRGTVREYSALPTS